MSDLLAVSWPTSILCPMCQKHTLTNDLVGRWVCPDCKEVTL